MKKQFSIFDQLADKTEKKRYSRVAHGSDLAEGKRKLDRPLSTKRPIHVVVRSEQARGRWSFLGFKNRIMVEHVVRQQAKRYAVLIQDFANGGNHLHIKIKGGTRTGIQNFLRTITNLIARKITGARRGAKLTKRFWDGLAFTRVLKSYKEEIHLRGYFTANRVEADAGPEAREKFLNKFREWVKATYGRPATADG